MMIDDDNDGKMIFGDLGGLKLPDICLTGEEKPRKKPHTGNLSRPGIEPGPAVLLLLRLFTLPQSRTSNLQGLTIQMPVGQIPVGGATVSGPQH